MSVIVSMISACAGSYEPIVDKKGVNEAQYQSDLAECRQYAEQVDPTGDAATGAAVGGAAGAATGAVVGAITGRPGTGAAIGGAGGGVAGLFGGGGRGVEKQRRVIRRCLQGRGYRVLE